MELLFFFGLAVLFGALIWRFHFMVGIFPLLFLTYFFQITVRGIPVTFVEMASYVLFAVWMGRALFLEKEQTSFWIRLKERFFPKKSAVRWWKWYIPGVVLLIVGVGLGFLMVPNEVMFHRGLAFGAEYELFPALRVALGILKGWVLAPLLYFVVLLAEGHREDKLTRYSLNAFVVSALILGVLSLGSVALGVEIDRLKGPFESPNYLAMYLAPGFMLLCFHTVSSWRKDLPLAYLSLFGALVLGVALLLTKTYASWIGTFVALVASTWFIFKKPARTYVHGVLLLIVITALALLAPTDKFQKFFDTEGDSSTAVRLEVYEITGGLFEQSPFLGLGLGQYEIQYKQHAREILGDYPKEWIMLHPHNTFFAFWTQSGLLGLMGFLWILTVFFVQGWRYRFTAWPLMAIMLLMIIHGFFDTYFWKNDLVYIFWMFVGLMATVHIHSMKKT